MSITVTELVNMVRWSERLSEFKLIFPVRAIATLNTVRKASQSRFDEMFYRWTGEVQKDVDVMVGWIKVQDLEPQRHAHVALITWGTLDCSQAASRWRAIAGPRYDQSAEIRPYRGRVCSVSHILKLLDSTGDLQFSDNLSAVNVEYIESRLTSAASSKRITSIAAHRAVGGWNRT
jgi:hypothetical protein